MGSSEEDASTTNAVLEDIPIEADEEDEEEEEEEEAEPEEEEAKKETAPTRRSSSSSSRRSSSSRESSGSSSSSRRSSSQSTSSSTKPKPISRTKPVTTTRKKVAPAPAPAAGGPVRVKFKVTGTGKMSCSNGTSRSIDGVATLTYQDYELPDYCRIDVSGQAACMATFDRSMTCTCKPSLRRRVSKHMRAVIQRVREASVTVDGVVTGAISEGLLILLGVAPEDGQKECVWLASKVANLRIFSRITMEK